MTAPAPKSLMILDVWIAAGPELEHHTVRVGVSERIKASRHFDKSVTKLLRDEQSEEALAYLAWVGLRRDDAWTGTFEQFAELVAAIDPPEDDDDEDTGGGDQAGRP